MLLSKTHYEMSITQWWPYCRFDVLPLSAEVLTLSYIIHQLISAVTDATWQDDSQSFAPYQPAPPLMNANNSTGK